MARGGTDHIVIAGSIWDEGMRRLREIVPDARVDVIDGPGTDALPGELLDATVLFGAGAPANSAELQRLELLQLGSAGYGQLAGTVLPDRCQVSNASGVNDVPIAEWCVLMMLALLRRFPDMMQQQASHRWNRAADFQAEMRGRVVGIMGFGSIGQEVARACRAIGLQVWATSRSEPGPRPHRYDPFDRPVDDVPLPDRWFPLTRRAEFLAGIDALVLAVPDAPATRGLIDDAALRCLPPHAVLLNPARAPIVDEKALRDALVSGRLAGAALDVHYRSPMTVDDPTWELPRTIVTPHISGSTNSTHYVPRLWDLFCRNIYRLKQGESLLNVVARDDLALDESRG